MTSNKQLIIAIDGHSSCGKSTLAKALAKELHYAYVDSGAMYRSVTLYCIENHLTDDKGINKEELAKQLSNISIEFRLNPTTGLSETFLNNRFVEDKIRDIKVSNLVSPVSKIAFVRKALVDQQRALSRGLGIVMDGRDIGTVVFPDADLKLFMTAAVEVRAQRRFDELKAKGLTVSMEEIIENIRQRDYMDSHREESPLRQAADAILLDNSNLNREEQLDWILDLIRKKFPTNLL